VAPGANILAMQAFRRYTGVPGRTTCADSGDTSPCVRTNLSDYLAALNRVFALRNTFDITAVNMSLGSGKFIITCDSSFRRLFLDQTHTGSISSFGDRDPYSILAKALLERGAPFLRRQNTSIIVGIYVKMMLSSPTRPAILGVGRTNFTSVAPPTFSCRNALK
jgi:hypothetical protein